jgi:hypothetical protein
MSKPGAAFAGVILAIVLAACAKDETEQTQTVRTQREKDSILANSTIPGAKAVKKSMTVADSVAARQGRMSDTGQQSP